jgi:hypothetical protein
MKIYLGGGGLSYSSTVLEVSCQLQVSASLLPVPVQQEAAWVPEQV